MTSFIYALDYGIGILRTLFVGVAIAATASCTLAWAARTKRLSPFSALSRFSRERIEPLMAPIEKRLVRIGTTGASAPWWSLIVVLIIGLLILSLLNFVRDALATAYIATAQGPGGIVKLVVAWGFGILQLAILVRVITSWIGGTYSRIGRLAFNMTEWLIAPIRRVIPSLGIIDISPLAAWFLLNIVQGLIVRAL